MIAYIFCHERSTAKLEIRKIRLEDCLGKLGKQGILSALSIIYHTSILENSLKQLHDSLLDGISVSDKEI